MAGGALIPATRRQEPAPLPFRKDAQEGAASPAGAAHLGEVHAPLICRAPAARAHPWVLPCAAPG